MKKFFATATFAIGLAALNGVAMACQDPGMCVPVEALDVNVSTAGLTAGLGQVVAVGDDTASRVDKESNLDLVSNLNVSLDGCTNGCGFFQLDVAGSASEKVKTFAAAIGTTPGKMVRVENAAVAQTGLGVSLQVLSLPK